MITDPTLIRIGDAVQRGHRGDRQAARLLCTEIWDEIGGERVGQAGVPLPVAGLYPSLHLNLSECYRKLGEPDRARAHLRHARDTIDALGDDEYGRLLG